MITARAATAWELNEDCTEIIDGPKVVWDEPESVVLKAPIL